MRIHDVLSIFGLFPVQEVLQIAYERFIIEVAILCQVVDVSRVGEQLNKFEFKKKALSTIVRVLKLLVPRGRCWGVFS